MINFITILPEIGLNPMLCEGISTLPFIFKGGENAFICDAQGREVKELTYINGIHNKENFSPAISGLHYIKITTNSDLIYYSNWINFLEIEFTNEEASINLCHNSIINFYHVQNWAQKQLSNFSNPVKVDYDKLINFRANLPLVEEITGFSILKLKNTNLSIFKEENYSQFGNDFFIESEKVIDNFTFTKTENTYTWLQTDLQNYFLEHGIYAIKLYCSSNTYGNISFISNLLTPLFPVCELFNRVEPENSIEAYYEDNDLIINYSVPNKDTYVLFEVYDGEKWIGLRQDVKTYELNGNELIIPNSAIYEKIRYTNYLGSCFIINSTEANIGENNYYVDENNEPYISDDDINYYIPN